MKAMQYRAYGGPEVLQLGEAPRPAPGPGQVLLRARASSVNPVDWKLASGKYRLLMPARFPQIPGFDVSGEVVEVGPGVTTFAPGDRAHARLAGGVGAAAAEFTLAGLDVTAPMPAGMDFATAAGLPLAGMTALQGLRDGAGLPLRDASERVLIVGASGGVGHLAVQIARAAGATVLDVCSARNAALVAELGAHQVVDYTRPDPFRGLQPVDVILDCVGGPPGRWLHLLTPRGRYASVMPDPRVYLRAALNPFTGRQVRAVMLKSNAADLRLLDDLFAQGKLRVVIDRRFPLSDLPGAWRRSLEGRAIGKIIIDIDGADPGAAGGQA
jgi:NADPH:quinone reductase-like Zn-dependent oxidoreductase